MEFFDDLYPQLLQRAALYRLRRTASPEPRIESGSGSFLSLGSLLRSEKRQHPLVLISSDSDDLLAQITQCLEGADLSYSVAGSELAEADDIVALWNRDGCDCLLAVGGEETQNLSKQASVCIGTKKPLSRLLSGRLPRRMNLPPAIAVPFAAGGAEALNSFTVKPDGNTVTLSAPSLRPRLLVFDPELPVTLSRRQIALSGLSGLCLALEAYLTPEGRHNPVHTLATDAIKGYLDALEPCWNGGGTPDQRLRLMEASYKAGSAASRTGTGFIRILCYAARDTADVPFDTALSIFLPLVLERYGAEITDRLAELSAYCRIMTEGTRTARASAFLTRLRTLIFRIGLGELPTPIPPELADCIAHKAYSATPAECFRPVFLPEEACRRISSVLCSGGNN